MPVFEKKPADRPRFPGEFYIGINPAGAASDPTKAYVAAVADAIEQLARDQVADDSANYPDNLLKDRNAARAAAMTVLAADTDEFIAGRNALADTARVRQILGNYAAQIPKFGARPAAKPRFDGDFDVVRVPDHVPTKEEQLFLDAVAAATREMAADKAAESSKEFSQTSVATRHDIRLDIARTLIAAIEKLDGSGRDAAAAAEEAVLLRGRYQARRDRVIRRLFNVKFEKGPGKAVAATQAASLPGSAAGRAEKPGSDDGSGEDAAYAILDIRLLGGLPPPEDKASPEKIDLYGKINKTNTVIRAVCERLDERTSQKSGLALMFEGRNAKPAGQVRKLQAEFLEKLYGVAVIGLERDFVDVAQATLTETRNEFFALEAGRIKGAHSNGLALFAFFGSVVLMTAYAWIWLEFADSSVRYESWLYQHRNFLLAACGAAVGTWASFTVRQVQYTFDDLMMLEDRAIAPSMRILFVVILALATCLLFWTNAINIEIGDLKTKAQFFRESGSVALLIGLFCGLSERALATAIAGRAASFVKGVGGA